MHWRRVAALKRDQKTATWMGLIGKQLPTMPVVVTITRLGRRKLDDDNLRESCKYVRDQIARAFGVDDGSDQYTWCYQQQIGYPEVVVEVVSR